jgi:very-short-patch-repair endonuclease
MTTGERTLWQHIRKRQILGIQFQRQFPIDNYIVDFYCKAYMLAIEIDGSSHDSPEAQEGDRHRQQTLEALGVEFLRFSEYEVCRYPDAVVEVIKQWLETHSAKGIIQIGKGDYTQERHYLPTPDLETLLQQMQALPAPDPEQYDEII